nr:c-type cytochrome [uncultured Roseateles sp.]
MRALPFILLAATALLGASPAAQANEEALNKAGCMACHTKDKKLVGPSFKDVAAKYKGQDATAALVQKVRTGGKGVYGPIPMPPNPPEKINDADLKGGVEWILKQ